MMRTSTLTVSFALLVIFGCAASPEDAPPATSHSYRGHEHDADIANFIRAYPSAAGTRLDDCVLCHTEGDVPNGRGGASTVNACDYCHHIRSEGMPFSASLNPFGTDYLEAGRNPGAFRDIEPKDSDEDGFTNAREIGAGFFPGRATSNPDKPAAPFVVLARNDLEALESHRQFMLANSHRQRCDFYAAYRGVRISTLLQSLDIDQTRIEGITVFAPDGFAKSYTKEQVTREYPAGTFHADLDDAALGEGKGIVDYPASTPFGRLADGATIPGRQYLLLAWERGAEPITTSRIDPEDFRIRGEGPYRTVRPQIEPSRPDRGSRYPQNDEHDYDDTLDHNAGDNVRGVTVIRIDPMPEQYEEFDAMNASWRFLMQGKLVIYGFGIE